MNEYLPHIHVKFSAESDWEETRRKTTNGSLAVDALCGNDPALMRAKPECVHRLLRSIVDNLLNVQFITRLPHFLTAEQIEQLRPRVTEATVNVIDDDCARESSR